MYTLSQRIRELFDLPRSEPVTHASFDSGLSQPCASGGAGNQNHPEKSGDTATSHDKQSTTEPCVEERGSDEFIGCDASSVGNDQPTMKAGSDIPKNTNRRRRRVEAGTSSPGQETRDMHDSFASFLLVDRFADPGEIILITGPSGSGKSRLMKSIRKNQPEKMWIDPTMVTLDDVPVIDCMCREFSSRNEDTAIETGLLMLSRVGLAEAWTYLRCPSQLSDGQRWRLILAIMIARAEESKSTAIIAMDEFAALLDRVTAMVVSRSLRNLVDHHPGLSAVVVTSHDDLVVALDPDRVIACDFGEFRSIRRDRKTRVSGHNYNQQ